MTLSIVKAKIAPETVNGQVTKILLEPLATLKREHNNTVLTVFKKRRQQGFKNRVWGNPKPSVFALWTYPWKM